MAKKTKVFVLDTSVLLHDHHAIMNFVKHDVAIPITVLEELDKFKIGNDTKNFSAREVIRFIDKLSSDGGLQQWITLGKEHGSFKVLLDIQPKTVNAETTYGSDKNDHKIINAALYLKETEVKKEVILVTKDINLRIKAKALGILAEDYETGKVDNAELQHSSTMTIDGVDSDAIKTLFLKGSIEEDGILGAHKVANGYYILKNGKSSSLAYYDPLTDSLNRVEKEYTSGTKKCGTSFCSQCAFEQQHQTRGPARCSWNWKNFTCAGGSFGTTKTLPTDHSCATAGATFQQRNWFLTRRCERQDRSVHGAVMGQFEVHQITVW